MARTLKGIRWTLPEAAAEFKIDTETLAKRVKAAGILAGSDAKFSTMQMCAAKYGDIESARLRTETAKAEKLERENRVDDEKLITVEEHERLMSDVCISLRQTIVHAPELSDTIKSKLLQTLETNGNDQVLLAEGGSGD